MTDEELLAEIEATPAPGRLEALGRGAAQGVTLGFGDELAGAVRALKGKRLPQEATVPGPLKLRKLYPGVPYLEARNLYMQEHGRPEDVNLAAAETARREQEQKYQGEREVSREANEAASAAHPGLYLAGEIAGSLPVLAAGVPAGTKALKALPVVAGQGAAQGAGFSTSDSGTGLLGDTALGAAGGLLGYGVGKGLGAAASGIERTARGRLARALAKATAEEAKKRAATVQSAAGSLGGARAEANRVVEAIRGLLTDPNLSPADQQLLKSLQGTPEYTAALSTLVQSLKARLPEVAGKVSQAETGVAAANALPAVPQLAAERVGGKAAKAQIMARVKRYGPPAVGSFVGSAIGGPVGGAVGALAGAGTRPMVHALRRMAQDPAVQTQIMSPVAKAAGAAASRPGRVLTQSLARAGGVAAMPAAGDLESFLREREAEKELQRLLEEE